MLPPLSDDVFGNENLATIVMDCLTLPDLLTLYRLNRLLSNIAARRIAHLRPALEALASAPFNIPLRDTPYLRSLHYGAIRGECMRIFTDAITKGALANLTELYLEYNMIGDEGIKAFSSALASGARWRRFQRRS
ncbi:hypothetical protein AB1Y20_008541 [Prymnesium parvum]|uniref:F-box domain-containing protein n=1 Tax=Prymnesium parvum TaxID=97485 RepID=A0AB34IRT9_PRYPA